MKEFYLQKKEQILEQFHMNLQGHSTDSAMVSLAEHGPNVLQEGKKKST